MISTDSNKSKTRGEHKNTYPERNIYRIQCSYNWRGISLPMRIEHVQWSIHFKGVLSYKEPAKRQDKAITYTVFVYRALAMMSNDVSKIAELANYASVVLPFFLHNCDGLSSSNLKCESLTLDGWFYKNLIKEQLFCIDLYDVWQKVATRHT